MLPFDVEIRPGQAVYEQVVYAAKKAVVTGLLRPGDRFPSVRQISQDLKINPNTAHKVVASLIEAGLLETLPGIGTAVANAPPRLAAQRRDLLSVEVEHLVVEALNLSLSLEDVTEAIGLTWKKLTHEKP